MLVLVTAAVFSNSLTGPFVLDDNSSIKNNVSIRRLWPLESPLIGGTRGRPLVNFTFALNYRIGGTDVTGYHALNLGIHVLAGLVLFGVVRRTLLLPIFGGKFAASARLIGFGAALLWLVHPLQTESVTYLVQRTESLMGLYYLLTFYCFIRAIEPTENGGAWRALAVAACFAGMACKEIMITAPLAVFLYDRCFAGGSFREAWRQRRGFHLALASSWIALAWLMRGMGERGVGFENDIGPWRYALTESCAIVRYFKLAVWPSPLVFDYGSEFANSLADVWPCALLVTASVVGAIAALRFRPRLGFLLAWPFLTLAPTSSFVPVALQPIAEHRMYLPLAGFAILAVLIMHRYLARRAWISIGLAALALGFTAHRRNAVYAGEITLWRDTVEKAPNNQRAHQNLGTAYLNAGHITPAEAQFDEALSLDPENPEVLNNLALVYARTGRQQQALAVLEKILLANPRFAEARYNLGCVLLENRNDAEARRQFEEAIRLNPSYGDAHINLASILVGEGKFTEAVHHYSEALRIDPRDPQLYVQRAYANFKLGRILAAIDDYERALELQPDLEDARRNLEILRSNRGS